MNQMEYLDLLRLGNVIISDESAPLMEHCHWHRCRYCGCIWEHVNINMVLDYLYGHLRPDGSHECPKCGREEYIKYRAYNEEEGCWTRRCAYLRMWRWASKGFFERRELTNGVPR